MMVTLFKQLRIIPDSHDMFKIRLGLSPSQAKSMERHTQDICSISILICNENWGESTPILNYNVLADVPSCKKRIVTASQYLPRQHFFFPTNNQKILESILICQQHQYGRHWLHLADALFRPSSQISGSVGVNSRPERILPNDLNGARCLTANAS